jgi:hypothetical protein
MKWLDELRIDESGNVFYKGVEVELSCVNIMNLIRQGSIKESLDSEVTELIREIKLDIILSGR